MPYKSEEDLPENVRGVLPGHAQHIYKEAFNSAYKHYDEASERKHNDSQEEVAHKVAWSAVKQSYNKAKDGKWHKK